MDQYVRSLADFAQRRLGTDLGLRALDGETDPQLGLSGSDSDVERETYESDEEESSNRGSGGGWGPPQPGLVQEQVAADDDDDKSAIEKYEIFLQGGGGHWDVGSHPRGLSCIQNMMTFLQNMTTSYQNMMTCHQNMMTSHQNMMTCYQNMMTYQHLLLF